MLPIGNAILLPFFRTLLLILEQDFPFCYTIIEKTGVLDAKRVWGSSPVSHAKKTSEKSEVFFHGSDNLPVPEPVKEEIPGKKGYSIIRYP